VTDTARVIIEVLAGLKPGKPEDEFTQRIVITSAEWEAASHNKDGQRQLLAARNTQASLYASGLMMRPDRLNWVKLEWIRL